VIATWTGFARLGQTTGPLVAGAVLAARGSTAAIVVGAAMAAVMAGVFATIQPMTQPASSGPIPPRR
jgi:hypothetical protein